MSTTTQHASSRNSAPWRAMFLDHLQNEMDSPELVLSTLQAAPPGSSVPYVPRARYCTFRGMWTELPVNDKNDAPRNEHIFESDLPTITTDARMQKVPQIFKSSEGGENYDGDSGGGGPVEAIWWVKKVRIQWRIKGEAFIVGPDAEQGSSNGVKTLKNEITKHMRLLQPGMEKTWSWSKELTGHFGNISPVAKGSFKRPPPGTPANLPHNDKEEFMGARIEDLHDPVCRKNFRVVIIVPEEVECLDLSDPSKAHRIQYTYQRSSDSWTTDVLWP